MELTLERPGDHLFIRSVSDDGIRIGEDTHRGPLIVSADELVTDWPVRSVEDLDEALLDLILDLGPEVVLIGTGEQQHFLPPPLMMHFYSRQVGVEIMDTRAACRTFNVLVSESRNVVAALIFSTAITDLALACFDLAVYDLFLASLANL